MPSEATQPVGGLLSEPTWVAAGVQATPSCDVTSQVTTVDEGTPFPCKHLGKNVCAFPCNQNTACF